MQNNFSFYPTIAITQNNKSVLTPFNEALNLYDKQQYIEAVRAVIKNINADAETRYGNKEKTEYAIPHGSVIVNIVITATEVQIYTPFLTISDAKKIPVLRQAAQLNFSPLTLAQIQLEDDKLYFNFSCPLHVAEPTKIYDVLKEICINADNYDDEFISKFNAAHICQPIIHPYSVLQKEQAWNTIQQYIKEAFDWYEKVENKRLSALLWDILVITILKIDYYCAPQGALRNEIEKTLIYLNAQNEYYQKLSAGKEFLKKIQKYDRNTFESNLYAIEVFIPYKIKIDLETIKSNLKNTVELAEKEIKKSDYLAAVLSLEYGILQLFFKYTFDDEIVKILTNVMQAVSLKPMQESATVLFNTLQKLMTDKL